MSNRPIISGLTALLILLIALPSPAGAQSRLSSDIIDTYTRMIAEKPESCDLRLSRATEYASQGLLSLALTDLNDALRLAPSGEKGLRFEILTQRAAIHERQMDWQPALDDILAAAELYPDVPSLKLSQGRLLAALGRNAEARDAFNSYRRTDPRSADALFGLATLAAREGDSNTALGLAADAVEATGRTGESFMRRAAIYKILGRTDDEINEYISALSCDDRGAVQAMEKLADMTCEDYSMVIRGFDRAIEASPTAGQLYILRAVTAQANDHHRNALADFETIEGTGPYTHGELNTAIAESLYALARYEEALERLDHTPAESRQSDAYWRLMRTKTLAALGKMDEAIEECDRLVADNPDYIVGMEERAALLMQVGRRDEAARQCAEAMLTTTAIVPELYFLRSGLVDKAQGDRLLEEMIEFPFGPDDPNSLRGFALLRLGRTEEALIWANTLMRLNTSRNGDADFTAACLFAQAGKEDEALKALATAIARGYDNFHMIYHDETPGLSIAPLRSNPGFPAR